MQRIDENTYIDDTLVTCAEYQLFIDEMREQGKYYQPDHWTSYQFSEGQSLESILGIRLSDAKEFCKWLTDRQNSGWRFRLPHFAEAITYKINKPAQSKLVYWINGKSAFAWGNLPQSNPRALTISRVLTVTYSLDLGIQGTHMAQKFEIALERALERSGALNFTRSLAFIRSITRANEFKSPIRKNFKRFLNRQQAHKHIIEDPYLFKDTLDNAFMLAIDLFGDERLNSALDVCIDIITLQERITGRSPAFEGIRLVKERIT